MEQLQLYRESQVQPTLQGWAGGRRCLAGRATLLLFPPAAAATLCMHRLPRTGASLGVQAGLRSQPQPLRVSNLQIAQIEGLAPDGGETPAQKLLLQVCVCVVGGGGPLRVASENGWQPHGTR